MRDVLKGVLLFRSELSFLDEAEIRIGTGSEAAIGYLVFGAVMLAMNYYRSEENVLPAATAAGGDEE